MSKMAFQLSQISSDSKERKVRFSGESKTTQRKVCIFCDKEDCWKAKCPELKLYIQQGHVSLDDSGFIVDSAKNQLKSNYGRGGIKAYLKPLNTGAFHVKLTEKGPQKASVEIEEKVHIDVIGYSGHNIVSNDQSEILGVLNSIWNEGMENEAKLIYEVLTKRKPEEKEENNHTPKKFRPWEVSDSMIRNQDMQTDKRKYEPSKYTYGIDAVDQAEALQIVLKEILNNQMSVRLKDLLAISPLVRKEVEGKIRGKRIEKPLEGSTNMQVNIATELNALHDVQCGPIENELKRYRSLASPICPVAINGQRLSAILDTGAEICVMPFRCFKQLGIPLGDVKSYMTNADGRSSEVIGMAHNVFVTVGRISIPIDLFVIQQANYDLLLGTPYCSLGRVLLTYQADGKSVITLSSTCGKHKETFISSDPSNMKRLEADDNAVHYTSFNKKLDPDEKLIGHIQLGSNINVNSTKYKSKATKVKPISVLGGDNSIPFNWIAKVARPLDECNRFTAERLSAMCIGDGNLSDEEKDLLRKMLIENDKAFSWTDAEMGKLKPDIIPPSVIKTVFHEPWENKNYPMSPLMKNELIKLLKTRLENGRLEPCHGPYSNKYFIVKKKNGKYRFIQDSQPMNKVTLRDAGVPPDVDEFSEEFSGYPIYSAYDYHSGYDQFPLDPSCRDLTGMRTPLGLLRYTVLPQGATNSPATCQRAGEKIFSEFITEGTGAVFIDDVAIKPLSRLPDKSEIAPGIRRFVNDFCLLNDRVLKAVIKAGLTFSAEKTHLAVSSISILGHVCNQIGRSPSSRNIAKILDWSKFESITHVRGFLGAAGFFRIWIPMFSTRAEPLFLLTRKNARFYWGPEQDFAVADIKQALSTTPVLVPLDYDEVQNRPFIVNVDSGPNAGGGYLGQDDTQGRRRVNRFCSFIYDATIRGYSQVKRELYAMMRIFKILRFKIYGCRVVCETDCLPLIGMINKIDVIDPTLTRWMVYIRLFSPEFVHVEGKKNVVSDGLSRKEPNEMRMNDTDSESDDGAIDKLVYNVKESSMQRLFEEEYYSDEYRSIGKYLVTLNRPENMNDQEFERLRQVAMGFLVIEGHLYTRPPAKKRYQMPRRVICQNIDKERILRTLHDEAGHRSVEGTFKRIMQRYYWKGLYSDTKTYCESCEKCQLHSNQRHEEPLHPSWSLTINAKWHIDVVTINSTYVIHAREDLTGWIEGKILPDKKAKSWVKFLFEEIICRYGCVEQIVTDHGELDSKEGKELCIKYGIPLTFSSEYHPQSNSLVEVGHKPIKQAIAKLCNGNINNWRRYYHTALWADRITVRKSTGFTPYYLMYGQEAVLPVELDIFTSQRLSWHFPMKREDLLLNRILQLHRLDDHIEQAIENVSQKRLKNKDYYDSKKRLRPESLKLGDLVIVYDSATFENNIGNKLLSKWMGPYIIHEIKENGAYKISEMDGTKITSTIAGNRIKLFKKRATPFLQGTNEVEPPVL